jgi:hypothetical protein
MVGIFVNRLGFLVSRGIVEHRVHLILQHWDIGRLRDVYWARALGSQGLATEVKSLIWGVWRHVDQGRRINSSTSDLEASGTTGSEGVARMSARAQVGLPCEKKKVGTEMLEHQRMGTKEKRKRRSLKGEVSLWWGRETMKRRW